MKKITREQLEKDVAYATCENAKHSLFEYWAINGLKGTKEMSNEELIDEALGGEIYGEDVEEVEII